MAFFELFPRVRSFLKRHSEISFHSEFHFRRHALRIRIIRLIRSGDAKQIDQLEGGSVQSVCNDGTENAFCVVAVLDLSLGLVVDGLN